MQVLEVAQELGQSNTLPYAKCLEWVAILNQCAGSEEKSDVVAWTRQQAARIRDMHHSTHMLVKVMHVLESLKRSISSVLGDGEVRWFSCIC